MTKHIIMKVLNLIGILLMVLTILLSVPLTIPKLFNYEIYHVTSESMEPTFPVGSAVYVQKCPVSKVDINDVIAFTMGTDTDQVMTHRIVEDDTDKGEFVTKGDHNNTVDAEGVSYSRVIGKVTYCIPHYGAVATFFDTTTGRAFTISVFAVSIILWMIAGIMKEKIVKDNQGMETIDNKSSNKKTMTLLIYLVLVVGIMLIIVSTFMLFRIKQNYKTGEDEYKEISTYVKSEADKVPRDEVEKTVEHYNGNEIYTPYWYDMNAKVEFNKLKEINSDVIGWIFIEQAGISYPVMHRDNKFYLNHVFTGKKNGAGALFTDVRNTADFFDSNVIVYGHHMRNGSMFHNLFNFEDKEKLFENPYFTICTPTMNYRYRIFSVRYVDDSDAAYTTSFSNDDDFRVFISNAIKQSIHDTHTAVTTTDKVVTLSTCAYKDKNRFIVQGVLVNSKRVFKENSGDH